MKIRHGFVSNSSSSSFICNICGKDVSGMDITLSECGMSECVNGHVFCTEHKLKEEEELDLEQLKKELEKEGVTIEEGDDIAEMHEEYFGEGQVPSASCPICQFKSYKDSEMVSYLLKKAELTEKKALVQISSEFEDFDSFSKFIKDKKK